MKRALVPSLCFLSSTIDFFAAGTLFPPFSLSDWDLQIAGGYYSTEGRYQGGIPRVREETLSNRCVEFLTPMSDSDNFTTRASDNGNSTACWQWEASKESPVDTEIDLCTCRELAPHFKYCAEWTCSRVKADTSVHCGDNCYYDMHDNFRECVCEVGIRSGEFCVVWNCFETDNTKVSHEYEEYKCVRDSSLGRYCEAWTGEIDTSSRTKAISCSCDDEEGWLGDGVCSKWQCKERRIRKCLGTCDFRVAVGAGGTLGLLGIFFLYNAIRARVAVSMCLASIWLVASAGSVLVWGGIDGVIFAGGIWGIGAIFSVVVCVCSSRKGGR